MRWSHVAAVVFGLVCCCWAYMTFADENRIEFSSGPRAEFAELKQQMLQLHDRVEQLEAQLGQVAPDVRFISVDRPLLGDATESDDEEKPVLKIRDGVDEGMMFDALQHQRRIRRIRR